MLFLYTGTDRKKVRTEVNALVNAAVKKGARIVRVSDANIPEDLRAALQGGGMFSEARVVVCDGVLANEEMRTEMLSAPPTMRDSEDTFFILEEKPDAATRKQLEKYSEDSKRYDSPSQKKQETIFALANALQRGKKKELWVGYQKELAAGKSPEAIHGVLFWAAKQALLRDSRDARARELVAKLTELPHESRRRGLELEYALELFVLR